MEALQNLRLVLAEQWTSKNGQKLYLSMPALLAVVLQPLKEAIE